MEAEDAHELSLMAAHSRFATRTMDWQQVLESREAEVGRRTVTLEPPMHDDSKWGGAPPHLTSHWSTIAGTFRKQGQALDDPPAREIGGVAREYGRKAFNDPPHAPPAHHIAGKPIWGGGRD